MNKSGNYTLLITSCIFAALAIGTCIRFIDKEVALRIWSFTSSQPIFHKYFKNIPNTLPKIVIVCTALFWFAYYLITRKKGSCNQAQFFQLAALVVPLAYLIKIFLQYAFGRTNIRLWLRIGGPIEFNWFDPLERIGGFPSGHTVVFTALFTAVWLYYPRFRPLVIAACAGLVLVLLLTSYHFISDIIAGMCCGILITVSLNKFLSKNRGPKS